jgi:hypothetical protein
MEQENIRLGKEQGFRGIFTTNSNKLTQLISRTLSYQVKIVTWATSAKEWPTHSSPPKKYTKKLSGKSLSGFSSTNFSLSTSRHTQLIFRAFKYQEKVGFIRSSSRLTNLNLRGTGWTIR